jgi:Domain of Unknown Function (DUF349)
MDILDRLKPRWRRSDSETRAAAVREMGARDQARLETIARSDPDPKVRRIAIKKLEDAGRLDEVAQSEIDEDLRGFAADRAREIRTVVASSDGALAECETALARLSDEPSLAAVAMNAIHEAVRRAALARIKSDRGLRDVARNAADPEIRRTALARIEDPATLRSIAVGDGRPDLALLALERITDAGMLRGIADSRNAPKAVRQRARALLPAGAADRSPIGVKEGRARQLELCLAVESLTGTRDPLGAAERVRSIQQEWTDIARDVEPRNDLARRFDRACHETLDEAGSLARRQAETATARSALQENLAARTALCERVEALDDAAAENALDDAIAAWQRFPPVQEGQDVALARRFRLACEKATAHRQRRSAREALRAKLEAVVVEAEALASAEPLPAGKAWDAFAARWTELAPSASDVQDGVALRRRFESAGEQFTRRQQEAESRRGEEQRKNVARLEALCVRLTELVNTESLDAKTARRALQAADAAVTDLGPLPPSERRPVWTKRLSESRDLLLRRLRQVEEVDEWRRWANVAAQEEIIERVEALLASNDLAEGTRQLGRLQEEWAAVASAPPDKAKALWERFRTARNELRKRSDAYLAENLEKKRALCAEVAALAESTAWNETADVIKRLQAEWKAIGPVPIRHAQALWQEFRAPCDAFFARRKEHFARMDGERRVAITAKTALCEEAEALADSTDWDATTTVLKRLQTEWKQSGPLPRAQSEALWQRFRTACDRFFERRSRRDELAEEAVLEQVGAICDQLDALADALAGENPPAPEETGKSVDEAWGAWLRLEAVTLARVEPLVERLHGACARIATAQPGCLRGTRLDPETTRARREKLCVRLEKLAPAATEAPRELSLQEQALALRDRLASNTIGGESASRGQETAREVERISATWALLGPVLDDDARSLAERYARARELFPKA